MLVDRHILFPPGGSLARAMSKKSPELAGTSCATLPQQWRRLKGRAVFFGRLAGDWAADQFPGSGLFIPGWLVDMVPELPGWPPGRELCGMPGD
jgi:hypothetical protein